MCAGNYAEEILASDAHGRPGFLLDKGGSFAASTTARDAFRADGKTGEALAANVRRDDIFCESKGVVTRDCKRQRGHSSAGPGRCSLSVLAGCRTWSGDRAGGCRLH